MASIEPTPPAYDLVSEEQGICQKDEVNTDIKPGKFYFSPLTVRVTMERLSSSGFKPSSAIFVHSLAPLDTSLTRFLGENINTVKKGNTTIVPIDDKTLYNKDKKVNGLMKQLSSYTSVQGVSLFRT